MRGIGFCYGRGGGGWLISNITIFVAINISMIPVSAQTPQMLAS